MPSQGELMRSGMAAEQAQLLGANLDGTTETAAGTTQTDAFALIGNITLFGTVASGAGARLPSATGKSPYFVFNGGANALLVYPATGETINASSANTAFSVTAGKSGFFYPHGNLWIANLSS